MTNPVTLRKNHKDKQNGRRHQRQDQKYQTYSTVSDGQNQN
jgi:hypothetical protein